MDRVGKSSNVEGKNDVESLGTRFEPTIFYPDRNEYELCIELPGCDRDLIRMSYDKSSGQLKLQGKKQKTEFVHQLPVPADCLTNAIFGRFRGDVLHIIMPRLFSEWPASKDAASKQEDDQKASSDSKATEKVGEDREKLLGRVQEPPRFDQKSTDKVKEGGNDRDKLPARVPAPPSSDQETTEKSRQQFPEISAPPLSVRESSRSVKEPRENYQKNIYMAASPPPSPLLSQEVAKNAKIVTESSKAEEENEEKKPSAGGSETSGLVARVKETGKATVAAAVKEENRLLVMIGAAVLAMVVIGASLRFSRKKNKKTN